MQVLDTNAVMALMCGDQRVIGVHDPAQHSTMSEACLFRR
jgi:hypothetical protein